MIIRVFNSIESAEDWVGHHRYLEDLRDEMYLKQVETKNYKEFWLCDESEFIGNPRRSGVCVKIIPKAKRRC